MNALARRAGTLAGIADLSLEDLAEVMGQTNAEQLSTFLHASCLPPAPTQDRGPEASEAAEGPDSAEGVQDANDGEVAATQEEPIEDPSEDEWEASRPAVPSPEV